MSTFAVMLIDKRKSIKYVVITYYIDCFSVLYDNAYDSAAMVFIMKLKRTVVVYYINVRSHLSLPF